MIDEILDILGGRTRRAAARLQREMTEAAADLRFESAAELRDAIKQLEALEARQKVVDVEGSDRDVVAFARHREEACGVVLRIRQGKLLGREAVFLANLEGETDEAVLAAIAGRIFLSPEVSETGLLASDLYFPTDFADRPLLEEALGQRAGRRVRIHIPQRGTKAKLVELAEQNALHLLEERRILGDADRAPAPDAIFELQDALGLDDVPRRIVCFDVSHTQGSETVAAAVAVEDGKPLKSAYRRFRIQGRWGNDDFRSMQEAVTRYFRRRLGESLDLPDLVVIDGGKGQLSAARAALDALDCAHVPVVSLAKREEEVFVPGLAEPLRLPRRSAALRLLQRARDEAHRFAVSYNRNLRQKRTIRSELATIPGVGTVRQKQLLERFGSLRAVARSSEQEIASLSGFGSELAKIVVAHARRLTETAQADSNREN